MTLVIQPPSNWDDACSLSPRPCSELVQVLFCLLPRVLSHVPLGHFPAQKSFTFPIACSTKATHFRQDLAVDRIMLPPRQSFAQFSEPMVMFLSKITPGFFIREWKKGLRDDGSRGARSEGEDVIHLA